MDAIPGAARSGIDLATGEIESWCASEGFLNSVLAGEDGSDEGIVIHQAEGEPARWDAENADADRSPGHTDSASHLMGAWRRALDEECDPNTLLRPRVPY